MPNRDLDSPEKIQQFVYAFYHKLLGDEVLGPIFVGVAEIELGKHLPLICQYWEKLLLRSADYRRHTMDIHRALDSKQKLLPGDFARWLDYFLLAMDENFAGPQAQRAKQIAVSIATNMNKNLGNAPFRRPDIEKLRATPGA